MATRLSDRHLRTGWHAGDHEPIPLFSSVSVERSLAIEANKTLEAIANRDCLMLTRVARRDQPNTTLSAFLGPDVHGQRLPIWGELRRVDVTQVGHRPCCEVNQDALLADLP
jgi:hypothetical protein